MGLKYPGPPMGDEEFQERFGWMIRGTIAEMMGDIGATHLVDARVMPDVATVRVWEGQSSGPHRAIWGGLADWIEKEASDAKA